MANPTQSRPAQSREVRLAARPIGWPTAENFTLATVDLPDWAMARCWCTTP